MRRGPSGACVALLGLLAVHGCGRRPTQTDPAVTFDTELVDADPGSFHQRFDGSAGKLVLGTGWYGIERIEKTGPWSDFSWATRSARVYFGMPLAPEVELVARLAPFSYPGGPPQSLVAVLNGTELPAVSLIADWQVLRVPLPAGILRPPLNDLELRFATSAAPVKVLGTGDPRELAAAVDDLAVVPRGRSAPAPESSIRGTGASREVTVRGDGLALPLPAGKRYRLRLGPLKTSESGISIVGDLWLKGSRRELFRKPAAELSSSTLEFEVDDGDAPAMLQLRVRAASGSALPPEASAVFELSAPEASGRREPAPAPPKPDVFFYVVDTLRADALGTYGARLPTSPRIDAFAHDAVTYERAWSASSWTLPATVSLLSGVYPFEHGLVEAGQRLPADGVPWLPELLGRLGYATAAISQWPLGKPFGLERGFGTFTLDVRLMTKSTSDLARGLFWQYLFNGPGPRRPLFAYVHVSDPHAVYDPKGSDRVFADRQPGSLAPGLYNPQVFLERDLGRNPADTAHLRALYDGEVLYADRQFGAFLDLLRYLGLYEQSLIILVSDHGEEFHEHGGFDHGRTLYEELLHVPLLVKYPGRRGAGTRISSRVSTLDLPPTILDLLGQPYGNLRLHGRPLPRAPEPSGPARALFAEVKVGASQTQGAVDLSALVAGDFKCVQTALPVDRFLRPVPPLEAYDLATDPGEHAPLAAGDARLGPCASQLEEWRARAHAAAERAKRKAEELLPEEVRRLRALGYLQ